MHKWIFEREVWAEAHLKEGNRQLHEKFLELLVLSTSSFVLAEVIPNSEVLDEESDFTNRRISVFTFLGSAIWCVNGTIWKSCSSERSTSLSLMCSMLLWSLTTGIHPPHLGSMKPRFLKDCRQGLCKKFNKCLVQDRPHSLSVEALQHRLPRSHVQAICD